MPREGEHSRDERPARRWPFRRQSAMFIQHFLDPAGEPDWRPIGGGSLPIVVRRRLGLILTLDSLRRVGFGPLKPGRWHRDGSAAIGTGLLLTHLGDQRLQSRTTLTGEANVLLIGDRLGRWLSDLLVDLVRLGREGNVSRTGQRWRLQDLCAATIRAGDFTSQPVG